MMIRIFGALFDKRLFIAAAIVLVALLAFTNATVIAADAAKPDVVAVPPAAQVKPVDAKPADKKDASPAKDTGKDANAAASADDEDENTLLSRREAAKAVNEAISEARKAETAKHVEELKKQGWIVGPVKDKSELPLFKMVYVKGGCFEMGDWTGDGEEDERPLHTVCVSNYYIAETEVTQKLWDAVAGTVPSIYVDPDKPVTNIKPRKLRKFINDLNKLTGKFYRLPTEAEWEYAARNGGKKERWAGSDNEDELSDYVWFSENATNLPQKVKQKKPNGLGLYDMTGNVWEWVEDYFDFEYYGRSSRRDPLNAEYTTWYTIRGGSYTDNPYSLRTTYRFGIEPMKTAIAANIGLRLAE